MVIVTMRKDDGVKLTEIYVHGSSIFDKQIRIAYVKKQDLFPVFNIITDPGLTPIIFVDIGVVINKNC